MTKWVEGLVLLVSLLSMALYVGWIAFGFGWMGTLSALIVAGAEMVFFAGQKRVEVDERKDWSIYIMLGLIGLVLTAAAIVLSPYIRIIEVNGFPFVGFSSVTDMFKHSYVVTAISNFGIPPKHPYFWPANLSYYYGYYLIPSLLSAWWSSKQNYILFGYILFTNLTALLTIGLVAHKTIKNSFVKILMMAMVLFGVGWDIFPMMGKMQFPNLIEMWSISNNSGLRVDNLFTDLLWTPQHFLAAAIALWVVYKISREEIHVWIGAIMISFVGLSSVFVALALGWWLVLLYAADKTKRNKLLKIGFISLILLVPYLIGIMGRGGDLFEMYIFKAFGFTKNNLTNTGLTMLCEYGLVVTTLPLWWNRLKKTVGGKKWFIADGGNLCTDYHYLVCQK